jgi:chromosome partitioning protein
MKIISITNQKGGVGKSTTAHALGSGLTLRGYRTLFVDLDPQGNLSFTAGANTAEGYNALGILQRPETTKAEIQHLPGGDIVASSPALASADTIITTTGKEYRLREALETVAGQYDYCIIDTPPALGILTINALTASGGVIIPAQADIYSLQGLAQLHATIETVRRYCNPALSILGIVLTRYNARSIIRREVAEMLDTTARTLSTRLYRTNVRECIALVEAQATKQSIFNYAPKSNGAIDYNNLLTELLEEQQ